MTTKVLTAHVPLAVADVDACRVIDHQAVQAWADSLDTKKPPHAPSSRWSRRQRN